MRFLLYFLFACCLQQVALAQQPSQKEFQAQMRQAITDLNNQVTELEKQIADAKKNKEDPETIKSMEDDLAMLKKQVTMMGGVNKGLSKVPDKTLQQAAAKDVNPGVPKKDVSRIKLMPDKILSDAELVPFVKKIHAEIEKLLNAKNKGEAQKIYAALKSEKKSAAYIGNVASSLWMSNYPEIALYIAGKECTVNIENANNLNNYATFLIMTGGEHAALPILRNLNRRFPNNSTILNNIGQAWYGLGDMYNANRYLDSTIKIYKNHSEANRTKSDIEKSEGRTEESIESLKRSLKENYTPEKEAEIVARGGRVRFEDFWMVYPLKAEPLGIEEFIFSIPAYPFVGGVAAQQSYNEWHDFRTKLRAAIEGINAQITVLKRQADLYKQQLLANPKILYPYNTSAYKRANRKQVLLSEWMIDRMQALVKRKYEIDEQIGIWREEYNNAVRNLEDCGARKDIATAYLSKANLLHQEFNGNWMSFQKQLMNSQAGLSLYANADRSNYLLAIAVAKNHFLTQLAGLQCEFEVGCIKTDPPPVGRGPLPDFDSLTCQYSDEIFIPPFTTIKTRCNQMSVEFDVDTEFGLKVKVGWEENLNTGQMTKGSLELGYEVGAQLPNLGPLQPELNLEGGIGIEFTPYGITEIHVRASASGELTGFVPDTGFMDNQLKSKTSPVMDTEAKISWNAGKKASDPWTQNNSASVSGFSKGINISGAN